MPVSEINDLVKSLDGNNKNVHFRIVTSEAGDTCRSLTEYSVSNFGNSSVHRVQTR